MSATRRKFLKLFGLGVAAAPALPKVAEAFVEANADDLASIMLQRMDEWEQPVPASWWELQSPSAVNDSIRAVMALLAKERQLRNDPQTFFNNTGTP